MQLIDLMPYSSIFKRMSGTNHLFLAPEMKLAATSNILVTPKADVWSFGILICEMLGGFTPFGPKAMEIGAAQ